MTLPWEGRKKEKKKEPPRLPICAAAVCSSSSSPHFQPPVRAPALLPGSQWPLPWPSGRRTGPRGGRGSVPSSGCSARPQRPLGASPARPSLAQGLPKASQVTSRRGALPLPRTPRWAFSFSIRVVLIRFILIHLQFAYN